MTSFRPTPRCSRPGGLPGDDPARAERIDAALAEASKSPLAIAELAAEIAALGADVADASGAAVRGDAVTGVLLAEAATAAAATLVEINLGERPDDPVLQRVAQARARAREASERLAGRSPPR